MKQRNYLIILLSEVLIGIGIFFLYIYHVRSVFETRTNFSHLSQLSRESLLRKEDALYYSFYKIIAEEKDFWNGYNKLLNLTTIEYPTSVNIVQRFHVIPEIVISFLYHKFKDISHRMEIPTMTCWTIDRINHHDTSLMTCEGLGEPFYFYLEFVWILGGFTVFILYMYASFLSETIFGGLYAVVLYIIFHKNAAKIYERPLGRENFAYPFIFWQMFYLSLCIARTVKSPPAAIFERLIMVIKLTFLTTASLLCWQFSSVIYATQVLIMITPWSLGLISNWFSIDYTISQFLSIIITYYVSYENKKYFLSWQNGPALALFFISLTRLYKARVRQEIPESSTRNITTGILMAFSSQGAITDILEKSGYAKPDDNPYSIYRDLVLHWSLQRRANFSTTLLSCNSDFQEVKMDDLWELIKTLFVKPYCLYGVVVLAKFFRRWRITEPPESNDDLMERVRKYVLEDFLEENRISMKEMSNKETEKDFMECLKLLEECKYDYEKYKREKCKLKKENVNERDSFINDVKKLKDQISENEKRKEKKFYDESKCSAPPTATATSSSIKSESSHKDKFDNEQNDRSQLGSSSSPSSTSTGAESNSRENRDQQNNRNNQSQMRRSPPSSSTASTAANQKISIWSEYNYHYLYSLAQLIMLTFIGISIKKLFFLCYTHGCVIAPTLCPKFWYKKQNNVFWSISLIVFFTSIIDPGFQNLKKEYLPVQTNNNELENMIDWININTEKDAIFGGPIEIIATIYLTTRRPIVNHPHLEMRQISDRTESVYGIYGRQQSSEIYNQCSQLKLQYLILSFSDCTNSTQDECDILSIWDEIRPMYRKQSQFCSDLINKNIPSFLKVFSNKHYGIIKMFSQSVQLNLKYNKMPEKVM